MNAIANLQQRLGNQRDWIWRGWRIRYTYIRAAETSKKPPIIFLHGFGAAIGHWRHNLEVFSRSHTVYALDILCFGASEKATANYSVDLWVSQVYDFWKTFIGQPVILVGHSIGSLVSLAAAATHPEMVQGLVMMNVADPLLEKEQTPAFLYPVVGFVKNIVAFVALPLLMKPLFYFIRKPGFIRYGLKQAYVNPKAIADELVEIFIRPPQDRGSPGALLALVRSSVSPNYSPNIKEILPNLSIPMLLIWGKQDRFFPVKSAQALAKCNDKLQVIYLEDVGHCPHDECPERVNKEILEWIDKYLD